MYLQENRRIMLLSVNVRNLLASAAKPFLDAKASPSTYPCQCQWVSQSVSGSVIDSFRFGDSLFQLILLATYLHFFGLSSIERYRKKEVIDRGGEEERHW